MSDPLPGGLLDRSGAAASGPGLAAALDQLLGGRDLLVVAPPGSGKPEIYRQAAARLPGLTVVVSPRGARVQEAVDALTSGGAPATRLYAALPDAEQERRLELLRDGDCRILFAAPEMLRRPRVREALSGREVGLFVVEEAHAAVEGGPDFLPDYLPLPALRSRLNPRVTLALSSGATLPVQEAVLRQFGLPDAGRLITGFNRPNLTLEVRRTVDPGARLRAQRELLVEEPGAVLVYAGSRRNVEEIAEFIREVCGVPARHYHGGLDSAARMDVEEAFRTGGTRVVVGTTAFRPQPARPDVRLVVHHGLSDSLEGYCREAWQAGLDGEPARAVLLYDPTDSSLQQWRIQHTSLSAEELRLLEAALRAPGAEEAWFTVRELSRETELPELKVRRGLDQLEAAGVLHRAGEEGQGLLLRLAPWDERSRSGADRAAAARLDRELLLERAAAYAVTDRCRRLLLLEAFGDPDRTPASPCCDNCRARQALEPPAARERPEGHVARAILEAAHAFDPGLSAPDLARLLRGTPPPHVRDRRFHGLLAPFSRETIEVWIRQLVGLGYLKTAGFLRPAVRLTPLGETALRTRTLIPLRAADRKPDLALDLRRIERELGREVRLTAEGLARGVSPEEIAARRRLNECVVYGHCALMVGAGLLPLSAVVPDAVAARIRVAIAVAGGVSSLAAIAARLPEGVPPGQVRCVAEAWAREQGHGAAVADADDPVEAFLSEPRPRKLEGPWDAGWALGFHSRFAGADWKRSRVGDLVHRLKYERDPTALQPLVELALALCERHPELASVDALVPVPPSSEASGDAVRAFAEALGAALGKPVRDALRKTRQTEPQKEQNTQARKRTNVAGAFGLRGPLPGESLLVLDDLFDSGATLEEITRLLRREGAEYVAVLTLTRTIHTDA